MANRLGISMRVSVADYGEARDCLAQDWAPFLARALPECSWIPIPNLGTGVVDYVRAWGIDGLILTGGNDVGSNASRDATEERLVDLALEGNRPLLGICRGLQLLQTLFGGALVRLDDDAHVGTRHAVHPTDAAEQTLRAREVNSYHKQIVRNDSLAPPLVSLAESPEGFVEALRHRHAPITAIMWHPEREAEACDDDIALFRTIFQPVARVRCRR